MNYQESEVIEILKSLECADSDKVLEEWKTRKFNVLLDSKNKYPYGAFSIYTFPVTIKEEHVADVTIIDGGHHFPMDELMSKYLGWREWDGSYVTYSHDSYKHYCLTVRKEFELDELHEDVFVDKDGKEIKYRLFTISSNGADGRLRVSNDLKYIRCFLDGGLFLEIENVSISGYALSERINHNIQQRLRSK